MNLFYKKHTFITENFSCGEYEVKTSAAFFHQGRRRPAMQMISGWAKSSISEGQFHHLANYLRPNSFETNDTLLDTSRRLDLFFFHVHRRWLIFIGLVHGAGKRLWQCNTYILLEVLTLYIQITHTFHRHAMSRKKGHPAIESYGKSKKKNHYAKFLLLGGSAVVYFICVKNSSVMFLKAQVDRLHESSLIVAACRQTMFACYNISACRFAEWYHFGLSTKDL